MARDWFGLRAAAEKSGREAAQTERDAIRVELLGQVLAQVADNGKLPARGVSGLESTARVMESLHQVEMQWRAKGNYESITGQNNGTSVLSPQKRIETIQRSRTHYLNDPLYKRVIDLTVDLVFGSGIGAPEPITETGEDGIEVEKDTPAAARIEQFWNDPDTLRILSSPSAQIDRARQLMIDGETPYIVATNGAKCVLWPVSALSIDTIIEHPFKTGVPLLYRRCEGMNKYRWYWAADCQETVGNDFDNVRKALTDGNSTTLTGIAWAESKLDESFTNGPYITSWYWQYEPLAIYGAPPFYAALDWGEANTGLAANLLTYVKSITAITYKYKGKITAGEQSTLKTNIASTLSLDKPPPMTGTLATMGPDKDLTAMDVPTGGAQLFQTGFEISRLMVAMACGYSTHYLGDPSTGNLATAEAMELPQLAMVHGWQRWFTGQFDQLLTTVLHRSGMSVAAQEVVGIDFPDVLGRNPLTMMQALSIAVQNGTIAADDAASVAATAFGFDEVDAYVQRVKGEADAEGTDLETMMESQPGRAMAMFRRVANKMRKGPK